MKLIKKYNNCDFLGLIDNKTVIWYKDHIEFGNLSIPTQEGDDYVIWHGSKAVSRKRNGKRMLLFDKEFVPWPEGRFGLAMSQDNFKTSFNIDGDTFNVSTFIDDKELVLHIKEPSLDMEDFMPKSICENKSKDVIIISTGLDKNSLLFYSKTGELLWQYTEEAEDLKINWSCIPIVDDVVVIISQKRTAAMKLRGFNIRTGELLWTLDRKGRACPNTFFVGEDKMLYGCNVYYADTVDLNLCKLNPFTGQLETWSVLSESDLEVMSWLVTMHGRRLYYTDNRKGKEFGVIDVDRKEIVCRQPLEIKKNVTLDAPVVTDDKVYVFIRDLSELRVYENVVDGGDAFDNTNRVECTAINESSITKKTEETNKIEHQQCNVTLSSPTLDDELYYGNKELKDEKKEDTNQLIIDVNYAIIKGFDWFGKYCVLINGEEIKIDVDQRTSFNNVDSFYEYSSAIVIKGEEIDKYDDATSGYLGYHDVYPGYMDISSYKNEESVLRQIPQAELKEILIGDAHDGYNTVKLIPKRYIEKMVIRKISLDWDKFLKNHEICRTGKPCVIAELDLQFIDKEIFDFFKKNHLICPYEDLSVLLDDEYVSSFVSRHHLTCRTCHNVLLMAYKERYVFIFYQRENFVYDKQTEKFLRLSNYRKEKMFYGKDVSVDYPKGRFSVLYRQIALLDKYLSENPDFEMSKFSDCFITNEEMKAMYEL